VWQAHSVRGFLSSAAKKHNLQIESMKNEGGDQEYHHPEVEASDRTQAVAREGDGLCSLCLGAPAVA